MTPTKGQCHREAAIVDGVPVKNHQGEYRCPLHGSAVITSNNRKAANNLRLSRYHTRLHEKGGGDAIKDLRDEVGVLRILLEDLVNAPTFNVLLMYRQVSDLVVKIQGCVGAMHKIEKESNELLAKDDVLEFAGEIMLILNDELKDSPGILERLASRLATAAEKLEKCAT